MRLTLEIARPFFEARHDALAARLTGLAPTLEGAGHDAARLARSLADLGLTRLLLPESLGGAAIGQPASPSAVDVRGLCLAREALAYVSPTADSILAVQGLGSYPIVLEGTPEQRARVLPGVADGSGVGAFALTEPDAGSDVAAIATTATPDGDGYVLHGEKVFISNVGIATHFIVFATVDPARGRDGITAFMLERGTPGLTEEPMQLGVEHPIGRLRFDGAKVPRGARVGAEGGGFKLAMRTLDTFRVTVGAAACGMAGRALDEAVARVRARTQFGKPLSDQPVVRSKLAEMATLLDASRLLVARAAHAKDAGAARASTEVSMAKLFATESAQRVVDDAVQLFGGMGVVSGSVVERLYREIRPLRIYEGTSEIQRLIIGGDLVRR